MLPLHLDLCRRIPWIFLDPLLLFGLLSESTVNAPFLLCTLDRSNVYPMDVSEICKMTKPMTFFLLYKQRGKKHTQNEIRIEMELGYKTTFYILSHTRRSFPYNFWLKRWFQLSALQFFPINFVEESIFDHFTMRTARWT